MSINNSALKKSAGVGGLIVFVLLLIFNGVGATALGNDYRLVTPGICCLAVIIYVLSGVGYAWFSQRDDMPIEIGPMTLGGAVSAMVVGVTHGMLNLVVVLFGLSVHANMLTDLQQYGEPGTAQGALIGAVGSLCCSTVFTSAIFGAAGGAIYAAIAGRSKSASTQL